MVTSWADQGAKADKSAMVPKKEMVLKFDSGTFKHLYETWIYQSDPQTKGQTSVWVFENEELPTKVKQLESIGKIMVVTFFPKSN